MLLIKPERSDYNRVYGQIAGRYGYLNEDQLDICIDDLSVLEERGRVPWLGEVGMMRGLLTEDERNRISIASRYYFAREEDKLIARVGVRYGFIDEGSIKELFEYQEKQYRKGKPRVPRLLGSLVARDLLAQEDLLTLLRVLERYALEGCAREPRVPEEEAVRERKIESAPGIVRTDRRFQMVDSLVAVRPESPKPQSFKYFKQLPPPPAISGNVINLSRGGVQATSPEKLSAEQPISLAIHVPIFSEPLETQGYVRWAARQNGHYRLGIMFTDMEQRVRTQLNELAASPFLRAVGRDAFEVA
jgi:hypothetical protein